MAGLYIHVPFCRSKCAYCDFYSLPRLEEYADRYVAALSKEWALRRNEVTDISTIYFGGGTPSALSSRHVARIGEMLPDLPRGGEFTVEFNPDDVTSDTVTAWSGIGANRASMGIQSLNDAELAAVGRRHSARQAVEAYATLRRVFGSVSVDIIIGLPGQTPESLRTTLSSVLDMRPEHLSVYILSVEPGTRLRAQRMAGKFTELDDDTIAAMYDMVCSMTTAAGYGHYEISNFALPGHEARHNSAYWRSEPYLGLGPAAHSFDGDVRRINPCDIRSWLENLEKGIPAFAVEAENEADRVNDHIMVSLRTAQGLDINTLPEAYRGQFLDNLRSINDTSRVCVNGSHVVIPEQAWLLSDDTISSLFIEPC